jgi:ribosomal protein S18 acetylase RimI-like enzyme
MTTFRKATEADANTIAPLLLSAMDTIVYRFINREDPVAALGFMEYWCKRNANQYSWQNCFVAEWENRVVAAANLYDGALLHQLRQPVLEWVRLNHNPDFDPEDETGPGEIYLDTLAVAADCRGKRIGADFLHYLVHHFVVVSGKPLGLLVEQDNVAARKLYLRSGFQVQGTKTLMGKQLEHLVNQPQ